MSRAVGPFLRCDLFREMGMALWLAGLEGFSSMPARLFHDCFVVSFFLKEQEQGKETPGIKKKTQALRVTELETIRHHPCFESCNF